MIKKYVPQQNASAFWAKIPEIDFQYVAHATGKLPLIRSLLMGTKAQIACFHINLAAKRKSYKCTFWKGDAKDGFVISDGTKEMTSSTLSEICGGLAPLARHLAQRWPEAARPSIIGFATDGHRIIFSSEYPACEDEDWLKQHLSCRSPSALIADDGAGGIISVICP